MSHKSASLAVKLGYEDVYVFAAGYPAWVELAGASGAIEIKTGEEEGSIDLALFQEILAKRPDSILLIDVRDPDEFAQGHFPTSVNIPTDTLEKQLKTMTVDKPIVFVCATGARSGEAFFMVSDIRPDIKEVFYVEAEIAHTPAGGFEIKPTH